jgi:hypothetical protein
MILTHSYCLLIPNSQANVQTRIFHPVDQLLQYEQDRERLLLQEVLGGSTHHLGILMTAIRKEKAMNRCIAYASKSRMVQW